MNFKENEIVSCFCPELRRDSNATIIRFRDQNRCAYIHFLGLDKRCDIWVEVSTLNSPLPPPESDQDPENGRTIPIYNESDDEELKNPIIRHYEEIHKSITKVRNIEQITLGSNVIRTWYFSPYPIQNAHLFICENCFRYFATEEELHQHLIETRERHPPGKEIYREKNLSVFELHGRKQKLACQNLCLLAKLFLDHKTLYYDVEKFLFYVLCECDQNGAHVAAYFSKEIESKEGNILACIVCFPPYQKKGYGSFLISLSYEIARRLKKSGGPERPLSDLGKVTFHKYWKDTIVELLHTQSKNISTLTDIERMTSIDPNDMIDILKELSSVVYIKGEYELSPNRDIIASAYSVLQSGKPRLKVNPMLCVFFPDDDSQVPDLD